MIKTLLVDDEPIALKHLAGLIGKYNQSFHIVATAGSVEHTLEQICIHRPDVVFMDIELAGENSFDALHQSSYRDFELVFVTAHDQFGIQALKQGAVDYVLKPINKAELIKALDNVVKRTEAKRSTAETQSKPAMSRLSIPTMEGLSFIDLDKILYCESEGRYTRFHLTGGKTLLVCKNLGEYEDLLPSPAFIRIHHHYMVNSSCIERYVKGRGGYVVLHNGKDLPVSTRKKEDFFDKLT